LGFERGAWLRLCRVPLHAWNDFFFLSCVFYCGQFLKADSRTLGKERFDYTRILFATSSLEIVKSVEKIIVDGVVIKINIVRECEFSLVENA